MTEVTFTLTPEEARALARLGHSSSQATILRRLTSFLIAGVAFIIFLRFAVLQAPQWSNVPTIILPPVALVIGVVGLRLVSRKIQHDSLANNEARTVRISLAGLDVIQKGVAARTAWTDIQDVRDEGDTIVFVPTIGTTVSVPHRVHGSTEKAHKFLTESIQLWRSPNSEPRNGWTSLSRYRVMFDSNPRINATARKKWKIAPAGPLSWKVRFAGMLAALLFAGGVLAQAAIASIPIISRLLNSKTHGHVMVATFECTILTVCLVGTRMRSVLQYFAVNGPSTTVGLRSDGIVVACDHSEVLTPWRRIAAIHQERDAIYFVLPTDIIAVPRKAFTDNAQSEQFLEAANAYRQGKTPESPGFSWPLPVAG
jgi:hypothetical protein